MCSRFSCRKNIDVVVKYDVVHKLEARKQIRVCLLKIHKIKEEL